MPRAKPPKLESARLFAWQPAALTQQERDVLREVCRRSALFATTPKEHREDFREIFVDAVGDFAGRYRAAIAHEDVLPTPGEIGAGLEKIEKLAETLRRNGDELSKILGELDERTRAALLVREDLNPRGWSIESVQAFLVGQSQFKALADAARRARNRYGDVTGHRVRSVARRGAGAAVKALCERFRIPYHRAVATETSGESDAVRIFRILSNIKHGRVEHYLA